MVAPSKQKESLPYVQQQAFLNERKLPCGQRGAKGRKGEKEKRRKGEKEKTLGVGGISPESYIFRTRDP